MIIAVDFDDVIHNQKHPKPGMKMGLPIAGAREALNALVEAGHHIIIHTVKGDKPRHIADWMNWYDIPYHEITRVKPIADFYIDDKAIRFVSWTQTLGDMFPIGLDDD